MTWTRDLRAWMRAKDADHAYIEGCGPRARLSVDGLIARIKTNHGDAARDFTATCGPTVVIRTPGDARVAVIHEPVKRHADGRDLYSRPVYRWEAR